MATKRPKLEEIVVKLRQVKVLIGQGMPRIDAIRQINVTEQTYYRWKKEYGGMGTEQLKGLKRLKKEDERFRRAVSDLMLDKLILSENESSVCLQTGTLNLEMLRSARMSVMTSRAAALRIHPEGPLMGCTGCFTQQVRLSLVSPAYTCI